MRTISSSRVNFEMNDAQRDSLDELQRRTGASLKDLINNGLSLVQWAVNETLRGNEIAAVNEDQKTFRVLVLPLLDNVNRIEERRKEEEEARRSVAVASGAQ